ncbi:winged helix-turn-helix domain-containing protein [Desulfonatronum parangueonense]
MDTNEHKLRALIAGGEEISTEFKACRNQVSREVASNLLIHREYASGVPARLVIEREKVTTYNANRAHGFGALDPDSFAPYPKNPVIGAFFREIDRADELGSGMRNMMKYGKLYGGADPQLVEGNAFRMIVRVPESGETGKTSEKASEKILRAARKNPGITIAELAVSIGVSTRSVERNIRKLQDGGRLARVGSDKGGHWEVRD